MSSVKRRDKCPSPRTPFALYFPLCTTPLCFVLPVRSRATSSFCSHGSRAPVRSARSNCFFRLHSHCLLFRFLEVAVRHQAKGRLPSSFSLECLRSCIPLASIVVSVLIVIPLGCWGCVFLCLSRLWNSEKKRYDVMWSIDRCV